MARKAKSVVSEQKPVLVPTVDKDQPRSDLKFIDMRGRKQHIIRIVADQDCKKGDVIAQVVTGQLVSWDPETRGILLGSWLKQSIEKPRGATQDDGTKKMVPVLTFLEGKNKKGFMYRAEVPVQLDVEEQVQSV